MCRSIKVLRRPEALATSDEVAAAALQFVRKVSGFRAPSKSNQAAFDAAVKDIAGITGKLLEQLAPARRLNTSAGETRSGTPGRSRANRTADSPETAPASATDRR